MKKVISLVIAALMLLFVLVSCTETSTGNDVKTFKVGICNYVDDASLNQIIDNIKSALAAKETELNVKFDIDLQNCNTDSTVLNQIISNFMANNVDLMVAVATPVAMQMQNATEEKNIPVVFAAVSDPVGAKLVDSLEKPGHNLTGTSDYLDTNAIMKLILAQNPSIKSVGLLYDVGQDASTAAIADAKKFLDENNIKYEEANGTNTEEVKLAAQSLISKGVEAVFTPTDNTIMAAELAIYEMFQDAKIPHYTGADSFALNGAFLGYGVDYANLGVVTGNMVADILVNGKNPGDVAVTTFDNGTATINTETCEKIGIDFAAISETFKPLCTQIKSITTAESFN